MTVYTGTNGDDVFGGNSANDQLIGKGGDDKLYGFGGRDSLSGGEGNDTLYGGDGNDKLSGGPGNDVYYGGDGLDTFVFNYVPKVGVSLETVKDYGFGEKLDFSSIDANWNRAGDQAFTFIGRSDHFTGRAGEMRITQHGESGGNEYTLILVDVDGDKATDMMVKIEGFRINFHSSDFIL